MTLYLCKSDKSTVDGEAVTIKPTLIHTLGNFSTTVLYFTSITKISSNLKIHQPIGINHFVQIIWALKINAKNSFSHWRNSDTKNTEHWILIQHSKSVQSSLYTIQHVPGILINKSACNTLNNSKWSVSICFWKSQRSWSKLQKSQNHTETLHYLHLEMYMKTWIWVSLPTSVFSISLVW